MRKNGSRSTSTDRAFGAARPSVDSTALSDGAIDEEETRGRVWTDRRRKSWRSRCASSMRKSESVQPATGRKSRSTSGSNQASVGETHRCG